MIRPTVFSALLVAVPVLTSAQSQRQEQRLAPLPPALPRTHKPQPTTPAITAADLMTRLYIFADDSMQGREFGLIGNARGTSYLASEVRRMGLTPAGDSGTFFQYVPGFHQVLIPESASLRVGGAALTLQQDFIPIGLRNLAKRTLPTVYGGQADAPGTLTPQQAAGKLVVFIAPAGTAVNALPVPEVSGAAAVALVALDSLDSKKRARLVFHNVLPSSHPAIPVVLLTSAAAERLFGQGVDKLSVGTPGKPVTAAFTFVSAARNVVAIIPGSDPVLRHEYVALGAHNDHIGWKMAAVGDHDSLRVYTHFASIGGAETGGPRAQATPEQMDSIKAALAALRRLHPPRQDSIYNGADDDGSGSVSLLEIAEHIAAMPVKPKRSIIFVWHTGEENDMDGSVLFTEHPTVPRDSIVVQLNADMIGRGDAWDVPGGSPNYVEVVGAKRLSTELGDLIQRINREDHHNLALDTVTGEQYYTRSDHYMYARFGIPIAFFITEVHPDYHMVTDEPEYIDYPKMARIASLISDIAVHVANLDHRLVVDHPKPANPTP